MSEPTPLSTEERYPIEIIQGVEGFCIGLNNYRIAGPKPWGGGTVVKRWDVSLADLGRAIPSIDAQATEIAALADALITAQIAYHNLGEHRGLPERCDLYLCRRWNEMTAARVLAGKEAQGD